MNNKYYNDNIDGITRQVKDQYTEFIYPDLWNGRVPDTYLNREKILVTALFDLEYIQHAARKKFVPVDQLKVLIAGCGTGEGGLISAIYNPGAAFTFVDISSRSLEMAKAYGTALQLKNAAFINDDIMTMDLEEQFDIIISTGVIHHLSDPAQGVKNLKKYLTADGVLSAMVYGEHGRYEVGLFQDALKILLGEKMDFRQGIDMAKRLNGRLVSGARISRMSWQQDMYKGDQHIVDLLLNMNEFRYTVKSLNRMLNDGGMKLIEFTDKSTMNGANYIKDPELKQNAAQLPYLLSCELAEKLNGHISKHNFFAVKQENDFEKLSVYDENSGNYTVFKSPYLVEKVETLQGKTTLKINLAVQAFEESNLEDYKDLKVDITIVELLRLCDGYHTLEDIFTKMASDINIANAKKFIEFAIAKKLLFLHV